MVFDVLNRSCPQAKKVLVEDVKRWILATRDIRRTMYEDHRRDEQQTLTFKYDVEAWYVACGNRPLADFAGSVRYTIDRDVQFVERMVRELRALYGEDIEYCLAKSLANNPPSIYWRNVARSKDQP